jgi:uncharacterized protein (DUF2384 family)
MATASNPRAKRPALSVAPATATSSSEAIANYRALVARTVEAFGDEIKASAWLSLPNADLKGKTPIEAAQAAGYSPLVVEPLLTRIEHGIDF